MLGLRILWRDWRGGELGILVAALVIAVAIVTGISLFADRLNQSIVAQSSNFLAADRVLRSSRPVDPLWLKKAAQQGLQQAALINFQSMVYGGLEVDAGMQLASVKAVSDSYPLRGLLDTATTAFGIAEKTAVAPAPGMVWVDSRLLPLMSLEIGDTLYIGEAPLRIEKVIINEPDRGSSMGGYGPRVLMNIADIPATHIIQPGSRVEYRYLFSGDLIELENYGAWLKTLLLPSHKWLDLRDSQPRIAQSLQRAEQFLLLAGALGVGLAGIAIALAARRYSERHYDYVAMMKSLGASGKKIMSIYVGNLLLLALVSLIVGCAVGWLIQQAFIHVLQQYFTVAIVSELSLRPFMVGTVTALVCLVAFAVPPLAGLQGVSPLRVLRRDLQHDTLSSGISLALGVTGIALLMYWYSGNLKLTFAILAGVALTFVIAGIIAWYLLRGSTAIGMQAGSAWRLALASLRRRGMQNASQAVIFSLAIMLLLMLVLVRSSLIEDWRVQLPEGTPNHFLVNVAEAQVTAVADLLHSQQLQSEAIYPMVPGRLMQINEEPAMARVTDKDPRLANNLNREMSLTWSMQLPTGNVLEEGTWWTEQTTAAEVSIESELAKRLGVKLGDELQFQIGSDVTTATVSSIRQLSWDSMQPNFYMMFHPRALANFPATYITSFYLPQAKKPFLNAFLREFPTITVIEMDAVIKQVRTIITQVSSAIELVLGLIVISGLLVLIASVQASLDNRFQESAILRTLGAKRSLVLGSLAIEFAALGLLAGFLAAFSAELSVYGLQEFVLKMDYVMHPWVWGVGPVLGAVLIGFTGFLVCRRVVNTPPVVVLREL